MPHWKAGKTDDQVLDDLKETQKQAAGDFAKDQAQSKGVKENKKSALVIENDFTPVEYDPQYILMVNHLKKYFPIKGGMVSKTVGWVKAVDLSLIHISARHCTGNPQRRSRWNPRR